jgi:hypothetical protein
LVRLIPAFAVAYLSVLALIPWQPREFGWYAVDVGLRMTALAPFGRARELEKNPPLGLVATPSVCLSELNRAHGYVIPAIVALLPHIAAVMLSPNSFTPWNLVRRALHAVA